MKTIKQIADEIGVSKAALQKRIGRECLYTRLSPHISVKNDTKYIDDDGESIIKQSFENKPAVKPIYASIDGYRRVTPPEIQELINQLAIKDKRIEELQSELKIERNHSRDITDKLAELNLNSQLLLKQEQNNKALLLPEQTQQDAPPATEKVKFWQRIFKKKKPL